MIIIQGPTGRWFFVGPVPARLIFENRDGTPLTEEQEHEAAKMNIPNMKYKTRTFSTREKAEAAKDE